MKVTIVADSCMSRYVKRFVASDLSKLQVTTNIAEAKQFSEVQAAQAVATLNALYVAQGRYPRILAVTQQAANKT